MDAAPAAERRDAAPGKPAGRPALPVSQFPRSGRTILGEAEFILQRLLEAAKDEEAEADQDTRKAEARRAASRRTIERLERALADLGVVNAVDGAEPEAGA